MDVISSKPPVLLESSTLGRNEPKTLSFSTTSELDANGFPSNRTLSSPTSPIEKPRVSIPSPSYDRNPDYLPKSWYAQSFRRNSSSSFGDSPTFHTSSPLTASPLSTHLADNGSNTLTNGSKHTTADHLTKNQYNKENIHQLEQNQFLHLEEVLNMCSDYEKQIQTERLNKPQQNRIKTNGSLPRDKKLGSTPDGSPVSPCSPFHRQSPDYLENPTSPLSDSVFLESNFIPGSPRTRIRTIPSPIEHYRDYDTLDDFSSLTIKRTRRTNREANGHSDIVKRSPVRTINNSESNSSKNHLENSNSHINSINNDSQEINDKTLISSSCSNNLHNGCAPTKNGDKHSINTDKCDTLSTTYKILTNNVADIKKNELLGQKYIFPPTDWHASLYADPKMSTKKDIVQLKNEQSTLLVELSKLKSKLVDLHLQKEEINRELIMERALLDGELKSELEMSREEEKKLFKIKETIRECDSQMEKCTQKQLDRQSLCKEQLGSHQSVLDKLKNQLQIISDDDLRLEIYDSIEKQSELLETEHKLYEDIEFSLLEEEAGWLTKREELHREHSTLVALYNERIARLESLRAQLEQISRNASDECIAIQGDINSCLLSIQQGHKRLDDINSSLELLEKSYQASTSNEELEKATEKQSQEDLDRISKITLDTPLLELNNVLMGRRTLASLQEIEKNRQIHLAKQGSIVIEEARKRVKELKQKVQNEVIAQWEDEQIKQRNLNHNSLNSIASEDYSNTESSELITTSVCSNYSEVTGLDSMSASQINISDTLVIEQEDGKKTDLENRALSNASFTSSDDVIGSVCFRNKSDNVTKRPLTRYLPVRNGELDLRAHIESAGHQIDACTHIEINNFSCRGYLSKLSVRFHRYSWKKRWFVFDRIKHTLSYYADRQEKKLRSVTYFQAIQEVYVDHMNSCKSPNPRQTFIVKTKERRYCLLAPTSQAVRIWVDVIFTGAEGYQEFTKV